MQRKKKKAKRKKRKVRKEKQGKKLFVSVWLNCCSDDVVIQAQA